MKKTLVLMVAYCLISTAAMSAIHPSEMEPEGPDTIEQDINALMKKIIRAATRFSLRPVFSGIRNFGSGPVAEFRYAFPRYSINAKEEMYVETHYVLDLKSLLRRIENTGKLPNYKPEMLSEERKALRALIDAIVAEELKF